MTQREYERDNYKFDHQMPQFYDDIIEARVRTAKALNEYRAMDKGITNADIQQEMENTKQLQQHFLHVLDLYYDLVKFKFEKSEVEKTTAIKKADSVHDLEIEDGIKLYYKCNHLLEDLEITSLEKHQKGRRVIG